ncbi:hypothetical protein [Rhizobium sp. BR 362]|uniref:hypothetical protein n=1 Tax=Rhizobium sp. BR 362 TaxID=3040670 RepID=UPI002F4228DC
MSGVVGELEDSLSVAINKMFENSNEPATKKELASVLAAVVACVEGVNRSYLANNFDYGSFDWREAVVHWHKSRDAMFAAITHSLKTLGAENSGQ